VIARSQLVEVGGGFRIPDVMKESGARLVEVGTTNRTHLRDFEAALTDRTALLLRAHHSNFRIVGFTAEPDLSELVALAATPALPVVDDLGSSASWIRPRSGFGARAHRAESLPVRRAALVAFGTSCWVAAGRDLVGEHAPSTACPASLPALFGGQTMPWRRLRRPSPSWDEATRDPRGE
jgi:seryl-tRNA(Sec) selenium transferase